MQTVAGRYLTLKLTSRAFLALPLKTLLKTQSQQVFLTLFDFGS